jgi:hypothetical protein
MSYELRRQILQELEKISSHRWGFKPERACELIAMCESAGFEEDLGSQHSLCMDLINLLWDGNSFNNDPITLQRIEALFLRYANRDTHVTHLCYMWESSQEPLLEDFIVRQGWLKPENWYNINHHCWGMDIRFFLLALKRRQFNEIDDFLADKQFNYYAPRLGNALNHGNPDIRQAALTYFRQLNEPNQKAITETLNPWLEYTEMTDWYTEREYYPAKHDETRVVISLLNGVFAEYNTESEPVIRILFNIVQHKKCDDRLVPAKAKAAIQNLRTLEGRNFFGQLVWDAIKDGKNQKELEVLAVAINYEPPALLDKILYLFLTQQFEKYDKLDFDRSTMYTLYTTSTNKALRHRINATVRQSGRIEYLDIISPRETATTSKSVYTQQKTTLKILRSNKQWAQLWQKVLEFSFWDSVSALGVLKKSGWQPESDYERELFARLVAISQVGFTNAGQKIKPASLVERPLGIAAMEHLTTLKGANATKAELPPAAQNVLTYIEAVLSYRFRHDIEVEFAPDVQPAKFDVELESN